LAFGFYASESTLTSAGYSGYPTVTFCPPISKCTGLHSFMVSVSGD